MEYTKKEKKKDAEYRKNIKEASIGSVGDTASKSKILKGYNNLVS